MHNDKKKHTSNDDEMLVIPNRQLSSIIAGLLSLGFFIFIGGYFVGKNHIIEPFIEKIEQDSFADHVYSSFFALSEQTIPLENYLKDEEYAPPIPSDLMRENRQINDTVVSTIVVSPSWYAQLIGYTKEQSACAFVQKLQKKGIEVIVKAHTSTTSKGQKREWYQVITPPYSDQNALQGVVDKIICQEKLKGVRISTC